MRWVEDKFRVTYECAMRRLEDIANELRTVCYAMKRQFDKLVCNSTLTRVNLSSRCDLLSGIKLAGSCASLLDRKVL